MTKSELVDRIVERTSVPKKLSEHIINLIFDEMVENLKNNKRVEIRGFGSFSIKQYKGYTGRNPKTGEKVEVKSKRLPFFKVGKELKEKVDIE